MLLYKLRKVVCKELPLTQLELFFPPFPFSCSYAPQSVCSALTPQAVASVLQHPFPAMEALALLSPPRPPRDEGYMFW